MEDIRYKSSETHPLDDNAFVFSFSTKKIYNIKKGNMDICDYKEYGPCFNSNNENMISISGKMLENKMNTCKISNCLFEGMTIDYEINNGEKYFYI